MYRKKLYNENKIMIAYYHFLTYCDFDSSLIIVYCNLTFFFSIVCLRCNLTKKIVIFNLVLTVFKIIYLFSRLNQRIQCMLI